MKRKSFLPLAVAIVLSSARLAFGTTAAYTNIIVSDHPISFWPLNETSGSVVHDVMGTNNGTVVNPTGVILGGKGILYNQGVTSDVAAYFTNAHSGYINVPYSTNLNTPNFSVELWLNTPTFPTAGAGADMNPVSFDDFSQPYGWTWEISNPNNAVLTVVQSWISKSSGGWTTPSGGKPIQTNWAHYVMTYNATDQSFNIYTNGILATNGTTTYHQVTAGTPLYIGAYNNAGPNRYYSGGIENLAIYNYPLNPSQVATHYFYGTNSGSAFINTQPASQTNYVGLNASFNVSVVGLPPFAYQWRAGSTGSGVFTNLVASDQIADVANSTLTISNLTLNNAGDYQVVVTNIYGAITSVVARLTILTDLQPSIVSQPVSQTNNVGLTASFNVGATGFPPLYYQWRAGVTGSGTYTNLATSGQISSVTSPTLSISTINVGNAGDYVAVVTNAYGTVTSSAATLTVQTNVASTNTIKLMCIGDSITDIDTCYWRIDLASNLVEAGYNFLMVGRQQGTMGYPTQRHHEGYSGYTSSQILSMIPAMMAANLPDIAMVHIGANDMSADAPNKTADNIRQIIQGLQAANSNMTIVVSQIIPNTHGGQINELDYLIPQVCLQCQTPSSHVVVADVFTGFNEPTMFDGGEGPHPNAVGGRFMCNVYTPMIESIMNGHIPANPPLLDAWPGPPGFALSSFANTSSPWPVYFPAPVTVAWGAITNNVYKPGNFIFKSNVVGTFTFNNNVGDPAPGYEKFGFVQVSQPTLSSVTTLPQNQVQLQYTGTTNQTYTLQVATDLTGFGRIPTDLATNNDNPPNGFPVSGVGWRSVASACTTSNNTSFKLVDPNPTNNAGFYRVVVGP